MMTIMVPDESPVAGLSAKTGNSIQTVSINAAETAKNCLNNLPNNENTSQIFLVNDNFLLIAQLFAHKDDLYTAFGGLLAMNDIVRANTVVTAAILTGSQNFTGRFFI